MPRLKTHPSRKTRHAKGEPKLVTEWTPGKHKPRETLLVWANREFGRWLSQWVFEIVSNNGDPEALPNGWKILAVETNRHPERRENADTLYTQLARLPSGGWLIVAGLRPIVGNREVVAAHESFEQMYTEVKNQTTAEDYDPNGFWAVAIQMLNGYIAEQFDPADPTEAAEQTVVGLGGEPRILPRSLTGPAA